MCISCIAGNVFPRCPGPVIGTGLLSFCAATGGRNAPGAVADHGKRAERTEIVASTLEFKASIMDQSGMERALRRIAHEIIENNRGAEGVTLVGIQRRGVVLARMLQTLIEQVEGVRPPLGVLDITFYRDDLSILQEHPVVNATDLPFQVTGAKIVMVDDVLYSGRTARAAMDAICDFGRPSMIQLAVMIDRGHRELPIRADYVGKNLPTSKSELVGVNVPEFDGEMSVVLYERKER